MLCRGCELNLYDGEIDLIIWGKVIPILIFIAFICEIIIKIKGDKND